VAVCSRPVVCYPNMRPPIIAIVLALTLASCYLVSSASPVHPVPSSYQSDHAKILVNHLSHVLEQSFDALTHAQHAAARLMVTHGAPASRLRIDRFTRKLHQSMSGPPPQCPGAQTATCQTLSPDVSACFMAAFNSGTPNIGDGFFGFPTFLCQLSSSHPTCAATLINYIKTCSCMDFQPLFNLACPTAPQASACSKQTAVQEFIALNTDSATSMGFFGGDMSMGDLFGSSPDSPTAPDLKMCGDPLLYRTTTIINNLGPCLNDIINAIPLPSPPSDMPQPGQYKDMILGSFKCALTMPSYRLNSLCSGNVAKCYSALQSNSSNLGSCNALSAGTCPAGCSAQLATFGSTSSTSIASCCVSWFQSQATAPPCSTTPSITLSSMVGPECLAMIKLSVSLCQPSPREQCPTPEMVNQYTNFPIFPPACSARSPASLAVQSCAVATASLAPQCADSSAPYVQSSLSAPLKTTIATLSFSSTGLSQVQVHLNFIHCAQVCASGLRLCRFSSKNMLKH
jgi:hypothetical protein